MSEKQKQLLISSGELISLAKAAKFVPYSQEYLSLLARKRRILAIKMNRDWLTTRQEVVNYALSKSQQHEEFLNSLKNLSGGER